MLIATSAKAVTADKRMAGMFRVATPKSSFQLGIAFADLEAENRYRTPVQAGLSSVRSQRQKIEHETRSLLKQSRSKHQPILNGGTRGSAPSGVLMRPSQAERTGNADGAADAVDGTGVAIGSFALEDHDIRACDFSGD